MNKVGSTVTTKTSTYDYTASVSYNSTTHLYTYGGAYQGGVVTHIATTTVTGSTTTHQDTQNTYQWYDSALQTNQLYIPDTAHPTTYNYNQYNRDSTNALDNVVITDGHPRTVQFLSNAVGQILKRDEIASGSSNTPHELRYSFNNQIVGYVSNNGTSDTDYAAAITQHTTATGTGYYRNGGTSSVAYADFDQSYEPLNGNALDSAAGSYTVMQGDSLQSIAASVWGDSSLWYLIADANGMTAGSSLTAGQTVSIPNRVHNIHNTASTFKVYDPNSAIGDVAPSVPKSKNQKCGVFGQILLAIIAIAVTVWTAGTLSPVLGPVLAGLIGGVAGSVASQVVGLATGIQKSFNWGAVAMAAISGAVGGGLGIAIPGTDVLSAVARGALGSAISQGIGVATGLQKKFDWAGVAAAGIGAGVASLVTYGGFGGAGPQQASQSIHGGLDVVPGPSLGTTVVAGFASMLANSATRTLINGSDFGDNVIAALPDTIGSLVVGMIADQIGFGNREDFGLEQTGKGEQSSRSKTGSRPDEANSNGPSSAGAKPMPYSVSGGDENGARAWSTTGSDVGANSKFQLRANVRPEPLNPADLTRRPNDGVGEVVVVTGSTPDTPDAASGTSLLGMLRSLIQSEIHRIQGEHPGLPNHDDMGRINNLKTTLETLDRLSQGPLPVVEPPSDDVAQSLLDYANDHGTRAERILEATSGTNGSLTVTEITTSGSSSSAAGGLIANGKATYHKHASTPPEPKNDYPGPGDPVLVLQTGAPAIYSHGTIGGAIGFDGTQFTLTTVPGLKMPDYAHAPDWIKLIFKRW